MKILISGRISKIMSKGKISTILCREPNEQDFKGNPVWCEYYFPSEIEQLVLWGEDRAFLQQQLIEKPESVPGRYDVYIAPW